MRKEEEIGFEIWPVDGEGHTMRLARHDKQQRQALAFMAFLQSFAQTHTTHLGLFLIVFQ